MSIQCRSLGATLLHTQPPSLSLSLSHFLSMFFPSLSLLSSPDTQWHDWNTFPCITTCNDLMSFDITPVHHWRWSTTCSPSLSLHPPHGHGLPLPVQLTKSPWRSYLGKQWTCTLICFKQSVHTLAKFNSILQVRQRPFFLHHSSKRSARQGWRVWHWPANRRKDRWWHKEPHANSVLIDAIIWYLSIAVWDCQWQRRYMLL